MPVLLMRGFWRWLGGVVVTILYAVSEDNVTGHSEIQRVLRVMMEKFECLTERWIIV